MDRETIREWAAEHDAEPTRYGGQGSTEQLALVPASERDASQERADWDEFFEEIERNDKVVMYHDTGDDGTFEIVDHDAAMAKSSLSIDQLEDARIEGEAVTTEVTETTVVEKTIVEHANIESERIKSEQLSDTVVDAELVSREIADCTVKGLDEHTTMRDESMFESGHRTTEEFEVEVRIEEEWSVTRELAEKVAIESRVVETDIDESESIEPDTIETRIELDDVERTILQGGVIDSTKTDTDHIGTKSVRSGFAEDDAVVTELIERKTVEEAVSLTREFTGDIDAAETMEVRSNSREVLQSEMADADEYDLGELDVDAYDRPRSGDEQAERVVPDKHDRGKTVVDKSGEEVGIVADEKSGTLYVDPHPSLTDKISAKLGWGDMDDESYPLEASQISEITHDEVHLRRDR
jgi:hypothetical protein